MTSLSTTPRPRPGFNDITVIAGITRVAYGWTGATLISFNEQAHLLTPGVSLVTYR